jgi:hypothetical protein
LVAQLGVEAQLAEKEVPSEHSHPYVGDATRFGTSVASTVAAVFMPVISVGFWEPYSAPALAAPAISMARKYPRPRSTAPSRVTRRSGIAIAISNKLEA